MSLTDFFSRMRDSDAEELSKRYGFEVHRCRSLIDSTGSKKVAEATITLAYCCNIQPEDVLDRLRQSFR